MVVDEFGEEAVHGAGGDADEVGELGGGEAAFFFFLAGAVHFRDHPKADAGFLREVEELFVDGAFFFCFLIGPCHGDAGGEVISDEEGLASSLLHGAGEGAVGAVQGFVGSRAVADADGEGEGGAVGDSFQERESMVGGGEVFQDGWCGEEEVVPGRLVDQGGPESVGEAADFFGDLQALEAQAVFVISRDGFFGHVDVDGDGGQLSIVAHMELVGEGEALQAVSDVVVGGLQDVDRDAFGFEDVSDFVEDGDAEVHFPFAVEFFHLVCVFDEKAFVVGEEGEGLYVGVFFVVADFAEGQGEEVFVVKVRGDAHAVAGDAGAEEEAQERGGRAGDGEPFAAMRNGLLRIAAGGIS